MRPVHSVALLSLIHNCLLYTYSANELEAVSLPDMGSQVKCLCKNNKLYVVKQYSSSRGREDVRQTPTCKMT